MLTPAILLARAHVTAAHAAGGLIGPKKLTDFTASDGSGFVKFGCAAASWVFAAAILLSIVMVLLAGITYMRSSGDPAKVKEATNRLVYAAIGVAVALIAFFFPSLVSSLISTDLGTVCTF